MVHSQKLTLGQDKFPAATVTVVRDRKIQTVLSTNQIARSIPMPSWEK